MLTLLFRIECGIFYFFSRLARISSFRRVRASRAAKWRWRSLPSVRRWRRAERSAPRTASFKASKRPRAWTETFEPHSKWTNKLIMKLTFQGLSVIYLWRILNFVGKRGSMSAQTVGAWALLYSLYDTLISNVRQVDDELNSLAAGTLTGIHFKLKKKNYQIWILFYQNVENSPKK